MTRPAVFADTSHPDALEASTAARKMLIVDATASWCQPCQVMDRVTWVDPNVVAWIAEQALAIQIDVDKEAAVAATLGIRSMPTVVVFGDGVELDRAMGLKRPTELLSWLEGLKVGRTSVDRAREEAALDRGDMQSRLTFARTLANSGRFEEATEEYVWLWLHMLEHQPSMVGVRGSFMLRDIERLVTDHEPARTRFSGLRDALGNEDAIATAKHDELRDWLDLTVSLGEGDRVVAWFGRRRPRGDTAAAPRGRDGAKDSRRGHRSRNRASVAAERASRRR